MSAFRLKRRPPDALPDLRRDPLDAETLAIAAEIVREVKEGGENALCALALRFGDRAPGEPLVLRKPDLKAALQSVPKETRDVLERTAKRIRRFAELQKSCLKTLTTSIPGGACGHDVLPVERAGCYAPGGRFPLPSSVLMTAVTARVAGIRDVWVASPKPTVETLAAAAAADADACLCVGGAQAIAALAYGAGEVPPVDIIVGPGNRFVTAAKQLVSGRVAIDMLAGPSELLVLADDTADERLVAADLLAQAEHDPDAMPILVSLSEPLIGRVERELERQLETLETHETARMALDRHGFATLAESLDQAVDVCNELAPEHLEIMLADPESVRKRLTHYGALFSGSQSAEVLGDYGIGPNHVLPTGGTARFVGGLSVLHFLRVRTWMRIDSPEQNLEAHGDAIRLAEIEGLHGHARAARVRLSEKTVRSDRSQRRL